ADNEDMGASLLHRRSLTGYECHTSASRIRLPSRRWKWGVQKYAVCTEIAPVSLENAKSSTPAKTGWVANASTSTVSKTLSQRTRLPGRDTRLPGVNPPAEALASNANS